MLHLSSLTLGYNGTPRLTLPNFAAKMDEEWLISGASGSGKTTLLYALAGLLPPIAGEITVKDTAIYTLSESERDEFRGKNIGVIFQNFHLIKSLTVMQNLLLGSFASNQPQSRDRAVQLLDTLGIADKQNALPSEISQGQQQRAAIARAVMHQPSLLLADEPTSSLDDASCHNVIALIKKVAQDTGATLVISTHDSRVKSHFSNTLTLGEAA
jgi:putative ABC transport system ATP-binding protein